MDPKASIPVNDAAMAAKYAEVVDAMGKDYKKLVATLEKSS